MTVSEYKKPVTFPNNLEITKAVQKYFKAPEGNNLRLKLKFEAQLHRYTVQNFDQIEDFYFNSQSNFYSHFL